MSMRVRYWVAGGMLLLMGGGALGFYWARRWERFEVKDATKPVSFEARAKAEQTLPWESGRRRCDQSRRDES